MSLTNKRSPALSVLELSLRHPKDRIRCVIGIISCSLRAGKPPPGLHLDVVKGDKLIEVKLRLMMYIYIYKCIITPILLSVETDH